MSADRTITDSVQGGWVEAMPTNIRPFLRLSRYDRPIGFWLLALPGWIGLVFAALNPAIGLSVNDAKYAVLIAVGAIAMRGAGCTYNDIVDRDLDRQVERTALRPLAAGTVSLTSAWIWLIVQCLVGLLVLSFFPRLSQIIAISSLGLIAAYPFMKRITYWPQAWLGLTFNWAALVAYSAKTGHISPSVLLLYAGLVFWTIGYDTIYACQDTEDDALIGVKSTARLFGAHTKAWVCVFYALCSLACVMAIVLAVSPYTEPYNVRLFGLSALPFCLHLGWQILRFNPRDGTACLKVFQANKSAGFVLMAGLMLIPLSDML